MKKFGVTKVQIWICNRGDNRSFFAFVRHTPGEPLSGYYLTKAEGFKYYSAYRTGPEIYFNSRRFLIAEMKKANRKLRFNRKETDEIGAPDEIWSD